MNRPTRLLLATATLAACALAQEPAKQDPAAPPPPPPPKDITWSDLVRSGSPIKFYGFVRMDAYYNTARMDSVILPSRMLPETDGTPAAGQAKRNDDQYALDPRLTRFGIDVTGPEVD